MPPSPGRMPTTRPSSVPEQQEQQVLHAEQREQRLQQIRLHILRSGLLQRDVMLGLEVVLEPAPRLG